METQKDEPRQLPEARTILKADDLIESARQAGLNGAQAPALPEPFLALPSEASAPAAVVFGGTRYACPGCNQRFAKWSVCQLHIISTETCQPAIKVSLTDADQLQQLCKVKETAPPLERRTASSVKDDAIVTEVRRFQ